MNFPGMFKDWGFIAKLTSKFYHTYWLELIVLWSPLFLAIFVFIWLARKGK